MNPLQIAVSGGHTMQLAAKETRTYTWTKQELGVPDNGRVKDAIYSMENTDSLTSGFWVALSTTEDSVKIRMYSDRNSLAKCEFRISVLYTI